MKKSIQNITKAILLVLPLLFSGCKNLNDSPKDQANILKIEKTECYGSCPVYSAYIKEKGWMEYYPKKNTTITKASFAKLSKKEFKALIQDVNAINSDSLKTEYDNELLMDAPSTFLTFYKDGKEKRIKVRAKAPKELTEIIKKVEKLVKTSDWKTIP